MSAIFRFSVLSRQTKGIISTGIYFYLINCLQPMYNHQELNPQSIYIIFSPHNKYTSVSSCMHLLTERVEKIARWSKFIKYSSFVVHLLRSTGGNQNFHLLLVLSNRTHISAVLLIHSRICLRHLWPLLMSYFQWNQKSVALLLMHSIVR